MSVPRGSLHNTFIAFTDRLAAAGAAPSVGSVGDALDRRLHTACHDRTPVEYEQVFYGSHPAQERAEVSTP